MNQQLLRHAWDALDSFKQAYPENWHEDDEQVMKDLMRTDMKMSGVQPKWVGLTDEEAVECWPGLAMYADCAKFWENIEAKLKEKNAN